MKHRGWMYAQILQFILAGAMSVFLLMRTYDGHGAFQNWEAKLISLGVWLGAYLVLMLIEWGAYLAYRMISRNTQSTD